MYVYINGENKGVGFRDKESSFRGLTGHYETNEGMFILSSDVYTVPIGERRYGEGTPVKFMCNLKIHFYDTEAMSHIEEYRHKMSLSENHIEFYLNQIGIFPDEEITINARNIEEAIELANKFYLEPINFINMMRMENAKENTEGMSIKHYNIQLIFKEINMFKELEKIKVSECQQKIDELIRQKEKLKQQQKFNWIEKNILKRKKYLEHKNFLRKENRRIEQQIEALKDEIYIYENAETIHDFKLSFEEAIELLEKRDIPVVLTENDKKNMWHRTKPNVDSFDGLILVHKTNHVPTDGIKKSLKEESLKDVVKKTKIGDVEIDTKVNSLRGTIHFAVNGEVSSHFLGNWDEKKYAILIPFNDVPKNNIGSASPCDTFIIGNVKLTPNCWILVPKGEKETVQKNNPKVHIIEYEGTNVTGYADQLVKNLGYSLQSVTNNGWRDSESEKKYCQMMAKKGYSLTNHLATEYSYNEKFDNQMYQLIQILDYVKENLNLLDNIEFEKQLLEIIDNLLYIFTEYSIQPRDEEMKIYEALLQNGYQIPNYHFVGSDKYITSRQVKYNISHSLVELLKSYKEETEIKSENNSKSR